MTLNNINKLITILISKLAIVCIVLFTLSNAHASNLDLSKSLRKDNKIVDAGWDNANSLWVVFIQEELTENYSAKAKNICSAAKDTFNIKNKFEISFISKYSKKTFKTHSC